MYATKCCSLQVPASLKELPVGKELSSNCFADVLWDVLVGKLGDCLKGTKFQSSCCDFAKTIVKVGRLFARGRRALSCVSWTENLHQGSGLTSSLSLVRPLLYGAKFSLSMVALESADIEDAPFCVPYFDGLT